MIRLKGSNRVSIARGRRRVTVAYAHSGSQSYVYFVLNGTRLVGALHLPEGDLSTAVGSPLTTKSDDSDLDAGSARAVDGYLVNHFRVHSGSGEVTIRFGKMVKRQTSAGPYVIVDYAASDLEVERPASLRVQFDALHEIDHHGGASMIVMVSRGWAGLYRHEESTIDIDGSQDDVVDVTEGTFIVDLRASVEQVGRLIRGKFRGARKRLKAVRGKA